MGTRKANSASFTAETGRAAQKKSAEVRRANSEERKAAKDFAQMALNAVVMDKKTGKNVVVKDVIIQKLVAKAIQDTDLQTVKYLFELIGEQPTQTQKVEVSGELRNAFKVVVQNEEDRKLVESIRDL